MSHTVFDLKEKKVVVTGSRDNQLHTYGINDYFYATYRQTQISGAKYWAEWTLYDVFNDLKYYKEYDVYEIGDMIQADRKGVTMHSDASQKTTRFEFDKDFIITKTNEKK